MTSGPRRARSGSAIIVGHVDSYQAAGVFYDLGRLVPGNAVEVTLANGETVHFTVTSVQEYSKAHFPASEVYGPEPYPALRLITCGGAFDAGHRSLPVQYRRLRKDELSTWTCHRQSNRPTPPAPSSSTSAATRAPR